MSLVEAHALAVGLAVFGLAYLNSCVQDREPPFMIGRTTKPRSLRSRKSPAIGADFDIEFDAAYDRLPVKTNSNDRSCDELGI